MSRNGSLLSTSSSVVKVMVGRKLIRSLELEIDVTHLLEMCLRTTYFKFQGSYYEQTDGAAMGSPVSPVVANIYMEMFEELALRTATHPPRIWRRYVDDTFCVITKTEVEGSLSHLNSLRTRTHWRRGWGLCTRYLAVVAMYI